MIMNAGRPNGGILPKPAPMAELPSMWTVYFSVADIDATIQKAKDAGGQSSPTMDSGGNGLFAIVNDPTGMPSAMIQLNEPQPWG